LLEHLRAVDKQTQILPHIAKQKRAIKHEQQCESEVLHRERQDENVQARPLEEGVEIVVEGARIGLGQITTVGDAVGIRVTRL
jgi:hypothetical protein